MNGAADDGGSVGTRVLAAGVVVLLLVVLGALVFAEYTLEREIGVEPVAVETDTAHPGDGVVLASDGEIGGGAATRTVPDSAVAQDRTVVTRAVARIVVGDEPAAGAQVEFYPVAGGDTLRAEADDDGVARIPADAVGPWDVVAGLDGAANQGLRPVRVAGDELAPVEISIGALTLGLLVVTRSDRAPRLTESGVYVRREVYERSLSGWFEVDAAKWVRRGQTERLDPQERRCMELAGLPVGYDLSGGEISLFQALARTIEPVGVDGVAQDVDTESVEYDFETGPLAEPVVEHIVLPARGLAMGELVLVFANEPEEGAARWLGVGNVSVEGGSLEHRVGVVLSAASQSPLVDSEGLRTRFPLPAGDWMLAVDLGPLGHEELREVHVDAGSATELVVDLAGLGLVHVLDLAGFERSDASGFQIYSTDGSTGLMNGVGEAWFVPVGRYVAAVYDNETNRTGFLVRDAALPVEVLAASDLSRVRSARRPNCGAPCVRRTPRSPERRAPRSSRSRSTSCPAV
ncbi:MAG: hypothetical protein R3F34_02285 [Planctomycetota bacterium]